MSGLPNGVHSRLTPTTTAIAVTIGSGIAYTVYALSTTDLFFLIALMELPACGGVVCGWYRLGIVGAAKTGVAPVGVLAIVGLIGEILGGPHGEGAPVISLAIVFLILSVGSSLIGYAIGIGASVLFDHLTAEKG